MARLELSPPASDLCRLAGLRVFQRGWELERSGAVRQVAGRGVAGRGVAGPILGEVADGTALVTLVVRIEPDGAGGVCALDSTCSCGEDGVCRHAVALSLAALAPGLKADQIDAATDALGPRSWMVAVSSLLGESTNTPDGGRGDAAGESLVAIQFELHRPSPRMRDLGARVSLRPVLRSQAGSWVRTGISWSNFEYTHGYRRTRPEHLRLLREVCALASNEGYYQYTTRVVHLDEISTRRVWDLLGEAEEVGLPLVTAGKRAGRVVVHAPIAARAVLARRDGSLVVRPEVLVDDAEPLPHDALLVGGETQALGWTATGPNGAQLHLAPVPAELIAELAGLRTASEIVVPPVDEPDFFERFYPRLRARLAVEAPEGDVELPRPDPAFLEVSVDHGPGHAATVRWRWAIRFGGRVHHRGLTDADGPGWPRDWRDVEAEASLEGTVAAIAEVVPELITPASATPRAVARLRTPVELTGSAAARLHTDVLPKLAQLGEVVVEVRGEVPNYREPATEPVVEFVSSQEPRDTDWFDLAVSVTVDGRTLPFVQLFMALARGDDVLVTDDGTIIRLRTERFAKLLELIHESRALEEAEAGALRVSRYQAGFWHDVAEVGEVTGPAEQWREAVRAIVEAHGGEGAEADPPALPTGLVATLRPYQVEGFAWLSALYRYRLGGILADDMGLGKTLQALALICHAREEHGVTEPFLVVAPTSVVGVWASEAARFAPGLRVAAMTQTRTKRGVALSELAAEADVVITSYTLLRLESEDYAGIDWAGKILDEAQFAKNHRTKAHQSLRELTTPFTLAITGTPMENNVMELWALFAITSPGLLGRASRFMEFYRTPIEKARDSDRLELLRRRIRPLILRRTKEQVAADLPEKQEQVIRLDLNDAHRRAYDRYLHRERQKVLKLLDDLNKHRFEILRSLTLLRQASLDIGLVSGNAADASSRPASGAGAHISSTKLDALMELVPDIAAEGHRVLVFSQFTRFLGAARERLEAAGIETCYLDGGTRHRADVIEDFRTGTAPVFLISLKAGGFGLTLTEADYCIMLDPWWNPAAEEQAVDRAHRIGQTRKVMVYRLVAKDTIEEKVLAMQNAKRELFRSVIDDGGFESAALSASDIRALLD